MKQLNRVERTAIAVSALFVVLLAGFMIGRHSVGTPVVLERGAQEPAAAEIPEVIPVIDDGEETRSVPISPAADTAEAETTDAAASLYPMNINEADAEELALLPGIGEVLAQRIVEYRDHHGTFSSTDEIMEVNGIGKAKYEAVRDLITAGQEGEN